jgi:hypothetical protein
MFGISHKFGTQLCDSLRNGNHTYFTFPQDSAVAELRPEMYHCSSFVIRELHIQILFLTDFYPTKISYGYLTLPSVCCMFWSGINFLCNCTDDLNEENRIWRSLLCNIVLHTRTTFVFNGNIFPSTLLVNKVFKQSQSMLWNWDCHS